MTRDDKSSGAFLLIILRADAIIRAGAARHSMPPTRGARARFSARRRHAAKYDDGDIIIRCQRSAKSHYALFFEIYGAPLFSSSRCYDIRSALRALRHDDEDGGAIFFAMPRRHA